MLILVVPLLARMFAVIVVEGITSELLLPGGQSLMRLLTVRDWLVARTLVLVFRRLVWEFLVLQLLLLLWVRCVVRYLPFS